MVFNMAGNKKCHEHLAHKEIIYFMSFIFQTQFHMKYTTKPEQAALKKTIKNILHILARLIHHSAVGSEILENNIVPIFSRVEKNLNTNSVYAKDMMYINMKLNNSFGHLTMMESTTPLSEKNSSRRRSKDDSRKETKETENRQSLNNVTGSTLLESYV